jgi:hypothetical protein
MILRRSTNLALFVKRATVLAALMMVPAIPALLASLDLKAGLAQLGDMADRRAKFLSVAAYKIESEDLQLPRDIAALFLAEQTQSLQLADLQTRIRDLSAQHGLQVLSASAAIDIDDKSSRRQLAIRAELSGNASSLNNFLKSVDASKPWLFVRYLQVRTGEIPGFQAQFEAPLSVTVEIWAAQFPVPRQAPPA